MKNTKIRLKLRIDQNNSADYILSTRNVKSNLLVKIFKAAELLTIIISSSAKLQIATRIFFLVSPEQQ